MVQVAAARVILAGGFNPDKGEAVTQVFAYDFSKEEHYAVQDMTQGRFNHELVCLGGDVYAIGGQTPQKYLKSCEVVIQERGLSPQQQSQYRSLHGIQNLPYAVASFGLCKLHNTVYIAGGENKRKAIRTIMKYDAMFKLWEDLQVRLPARLKSPILVPVWLNQILILGGLECCTRQSLQDSSCSTWQPNRSILALDLNSRALSKSRSGIRIREQVCFATALRDQLMVYASSEAYAYSINSDDLGPLAVCAAHAQTLKSSLQQFQAAGAKC